MKEKLATRIAHRLAADIQQRDWPVGEILGREADLVRRLKISRESFREAVQILEMQGIARMERGAHGGLRIQAPAAAGVASMVRRYVEFADISFPEVRQVHHFLARYSCERAIERMTLAHANALRRAAVPAQTYRSRDEEAMAIGSVFAQLLEASDSPTLSMLMAALQRLIADFGHHERYPQRVWASVQTRMWALAAELAERAGRRDLAGALQIVDNIGRELDDLLSGLQRRNARTWNTASFLGGNYRSAVLGHRVHGSVDGNEGRPNRAIELSYSLMAEVRRKGLPPGTKVGSEVELTKRFGVSRGTLREAIRTLEFFGVARVLRGNEGGLVVREQDPSLVIDAAVLFMSYVTFDLRGTAELLARLTQEHGRLAARHVAHSELVRLQEAVRQQLTRKPTVDATLPLFRQWALLANNRVLALIIEILATAQGRLTNGSVNVRASLKGALTQLEQALVEPNLDDFAAAICSAGMLLQQSIGGVPEPRPTRGTASAKHTKAAAKRPRHKRLTT